MRSVARDVLHDVVDVDRGFLHTLIELSRRPGAMIAGYVHGRTALYTGPAKYFVVLAAVTTLLYANTGMAEATAEAYGMGQSGAAASFQARTVELVSTWLNVIMALGLPFNALFTRLLFRRAGYNFAEHLIFNTYVYAHACLLFVGVMVPLYAGGMAIGAATGIYFTLYLAYAAWAAVQFFRAPVVGGTVRMLLAAVLGYLAYMLVVFVGAVAFAVAYVLATR